MLDCGRLISQSLQSPCAVAAQLCRIEQRILFQEIIYFVDCEAALLFVLQYPKLGVGKTCSGSLLGLVMDRLV